MDGDVNGTCFAVGSYERGKGRRMEVRVNKDWAEVK